MSGPWEEFQQTGAGAIDPWSAFAPQNPDEFAAAASGMSHQQMVDAYRKTKPGDAWGDFLAGEIVKPQSGETKEQAAQRVYGGKVRNPSKLVSAIAGAADAASFGFGDEIAARVGSILGDGSYSDNVARQREFARQARMANPKTYLGGQVAGAIAPAIVSGGASAGGGLGGRMLGGAAMGAGQGAVYGYGSGAGDARSQLTEAIKGGIIGGALGGAAPVAGAAIGQTWRGAVNYLANRGIDGKAAAKIVDMLKSAGHTPQTAQAELSKLGNDAMLADIAPVPAGGTSIATPSAGGLMTERLAARRAAGQGRVSADLDAAFGPPKDPFVVASEMQAAKRGIGPQYEAALDGQYGFPTPDAVNSIVGDTANVMSSQNRSVMSGLQNQITDALSASDAKTQAMRLLDIRKTLDAQIVRDPMQYGMLSSADKAAQNALKQGRTIIDDVLKKNVPGLAEADASFAPVAKMQEAFNTGRTDVLRGGSNTMTPAELQAIMGKMNAPQQDMLRQGMRTEIDRTLSNTRRNPGYQVDAITSRDWNAEKIANAIGSQKAENLANAVRRENTFTNTSNLVETGRGSRTAVLQSAKDIWGTRGGVTDGLAEAVAGGGLTGGPVTAAATGGAAIAKNIFRKIIGKVGGPNERLVNRAADLLTKTGPDRDAAIMDIMSRAAGKAKTSDQARKIEAMTSLILGRALVLPTAAQYAQPASR